MGRNGYRLLGFVVWRGAKWYLRRRLPSARTLAISGLALGAGVAAAAVAAGRRAGA
jgi:hypothetical protein